MKASDQTFSKNRIRTVPPEGMRLNKFLSDAGVCSRREADRLVEAGRVEVDGTAAVLGQKIRSGQHVSVDGREVFLEERLVLLAVHKPSGVECTTDRKNPDNIVDFVDYDSRVFPIGRLDKNSTGLILMTNMGELSDQILRSSNHHEKEYVVETDRALTADFLAKMQAGITIYIDNEDRTVTTRPCRVRKLGESSFSIVLTQGFNRQIRRMCRALGYEVTSLKRVRVMNIRLGDLPEGKWRSVSESELQELLRKLNES